MRSCANRLQESGVILCSTLYNRPFARWRHFTVYNQNPSEFCFLVQIRAFSNSKLTGIIKFNNERENEMNSALSSKKKSSCKWPILKKMHSPLFRWVGVGGNIQGSGCLPFSKASRKYSWKANGTRLFASFQQKKKNLWGQRNIWKVSRVFPEGIGSFSNDDGDGQRGRPLGLY